MDDIRVATRHNTIFVVAFRLNGQVNNFSVMSGRSQRFLGLTSTVGSKCVLLKDTTRCHLWESNPGLLDSESDALPLRHRASPTLFILQCSAIENGELERFSKRLSHIMDSVRHVK